MATRLDPADPVGTAGVVDDETLRLLALVERAVGQRLEEALRAHGAGIEQWRILSLLVAQGGCPMNVVAEHAMMLAPKLSKLVDRMVSANLVMRRPDELDRRRVLLVASPRGRQALASWEDATAEVRRQFLQILGPDAAVFDALLRRLREGLAATGLPAPADPDGSADPA